MQITVNKSIKRGCRWHMPWTSDFSDSDFLIQTTTSQGLWWTLYLEKCISEQHLQVWEHNYELLRSRTCVDNYQSKYVLYTVFDLFRLQKPLFFFLSRSTLDYFASNFSQSNHKQRPLFIIPSTKTVYFNGDYFSNKPHPSTTPANQRCIIKYNRNTRKQIFKPERNLFTPSASHDCLVAEVQFNRQLKPGSLLHRQAAEISDTSASVRERSRNDSCKYIY